MPDGGGHLRVQLVVIVVDRPNEGGDTLLQLATLLRVRAGARGAVADRWRGARVSGGLRWPSAAPVGRAVACRQGPARAERDKPSSGPQIIAISSCGAIHAMIALIP